jgi:hypothetical protein
MPSMLAQESGSTFGGIEAEQVYPRQPHGVQSAHCNTAIEIEHMIEIETEHSQ